MGINHNDRDSYSKRDKLDKLTEDEVRFLGELYKQIEDKKKTFEEYIEEYRRHQIDKYLRGEHDES